MALAPLLLHAQLDKIQPGMSEEAFNQKKTGAVRSLEKEEYWIPSIDSIGDFSGESRWKISNDSVREYYFRSNTVCGPSLNFPKLDSTAVHNMKVELEKIKGLLQAKLGAPFMYVNSPLTSFPASEKNFTCYRAEWMLPNGNKVALNVSNVLQINAPNGPAHQKEPTCESYFLTISIQEVTAYTKLKFGVGMSGSEFNKAFPVQGKLLRNPNLHVYSLLDPATCSNAGWVFEFTDNKLSSFQYSAYYGTGYSAKSDEEAYFKLKDPTERLVTEGKAAFGKPDTMSNALVNIYTVGDRQWTFNINDLYCTWQTKTGTVLLTYIERGGGKNPATTFELNVSYKEGTRVTSSDE